MKTTIAVSTFLFLFLFGNSQNQSLSLDSTAQYVEIGKTGEIEFERNRRFTIECWIKTSAHGLGGSPGTIISKMDTGITKRGFDFRIEDGDPVFILSHDIRSSYIRVEPAAVDVSDGQYHHIALVYKGMSDGRQMDFFVDGQGRGTIVFKNNLADSAKNDFPVLIGSKLGQDPFHGLIDDLRIWSTARTPFQINQSYLDELDGSEFQLKAYYKFDNDSASCVFDCTDNQFHAKLLPEANGTSLPSFSTDVPSISDVACGNVPTTNCFTNTSVYPLETLDLELYPNPSTGRIFINNPERISIEEIRLLDITGREVYKNTEVKDRLDVSNLPAGVYSVLITTKKHSYAELIQIDSK